MAIIDNPMESGRASRPDSVKVWDPFVRLFHWSLAGVFAFAWITAEEWDRAHELAGYTIAALVGLRILWGLIGTQYARFSDFVHGPSAVLGYLKDSARFRARRYLGHNPAGGAMIVALLVSLLVAAGTGFMTTTDAYRAAKWVEELHEGAANLTIALAFLHVLGVAVGSLQHGENLVRAMFTGRKRRQG